LFLEKTNSLQSLFIELRDADFGVEEDGADFELAAEGPDVLRQRAYIKVGTALDPGDLALTRSEMFSHFGLRDGAGLPQFVQARNRARSPFGGLPSFDRPVLEHFAEFAYSHAGIMPRRICGWPHIST
jgi:hypothetical protein